MHFPGIPYSGSPFVCLPRRFFIARHVVQIKTIFLQFFSCKSVKN